MKFYLHISNPKTGTTFLQNKIFPNIKSFKYIGKPYSDDFNLFVNKIINLDDASFKNEKMLLINNLNNYFSKFPIQKFIISEEAFLQPINYHSNSKILKKDIYKNTKRLFQLLYPLGEIKFLLTLRRHPNILKSNFIANIFKINKRFSHIDIVNNLKNINNEFSYIIDSFNYGKMYSHLLKLSQTNILIYEDLLNNKKQYFSDISNFLEQNIYFNSEDLSFEKVNPTKTNISLMYNFNELIKVLLSFLFIETVKKKKQKLKFILNQIKVLFKLIVYKKYINKIINFDMNKEIKLINKYYSNDINKLPLEILDRIKKHKYFE